MDKHADTKRTCITARDNQLHPLLYALTSKGRVRLHSCPFYPSFFIFKKQNLIEQRGFSALLCNIFLQIIFAIKIPLHLQKTPFVFSKYGVKGKGM